jgi:hypothetical protein
MVLLLQFKTQIHSNKQKAAFSPNSQTLGHSLQQVKEVLEIFQLDLGSHLNLQLALDNHQQALVPLHPDLDNHQLDLVPNLHPDSVNLLLGSALQTQDFNSKLKEALEDFKPLNLKLIQEQTLATSSLLEIIKKFIMAVL